MTMITDIQYFIDKNAKVQDLPLETKELLIFLAAIIEAATTEYERPVTLSSVNCQKIIMEETCYGEIEVWVYADNNKIGWSCLECGDEGIISNWEETPWDKRNYTRH